MRESIFDPYVTTKSDGTGLGLAIGKKIVVEHGGAIDAGPSPLGGARFRIRIPRLSTPAGQAVQETSVAAAGSGVRSL
jgi:two-component system nitrogen regulation sensor histidine kinase NtrY